MIHISKNHKKLNSKKQLFIKFATLFLFSFLFPLLTCTGQIYINGKVYFDDDGKERPTIKILRDNLPYEQSKASKNGRFNAKLPIGHDYMFEISKPYNYTTRLAVSTKFPSHIPTDEVYGNFKVETDLIPYYEGLDGTILNYPVMILRYKEESQAFVNDTVYLEVIREKVEKLITQVEKLERKGVSRVATNLSKKEMERIDLVEFLAKSDTLIREEFLLLSSSHKLGEGPVDTTKKKEDRAKKKIDTVKKIEPKRIAIKTEPESVDSSLITTKNETTEPTASNKNQQAYVETDGEPVDLATAEPNEVEIESKNDTIELAEAEASETSETSKKLAKQKKSKVELPHEKPVLDEGEDEGESPFYQTTWFYIGLFGFIFLLIFFLLKRKREAA